MSISIEVLSGLAAKAPAAIVLQTAQKRFLLDSGACIGTAHVPWTFPADIDAVFISHDHIDHIGGVANIPAHIPVYCSEFVASRLPAHCHAITLPIQGTTHVMGITVTTGAAGHALGGIWFHFAVEGGVFYSGDFSFESELYRFDLPPAANIALLDMSYGNYDTGMEMQKQRLSAVLHAQCGSGYVLLPVPASGRGIEMAIWLMDRYPGQVGIDRNGFQHINQAMLGLDMGLKIESGRCLRAMHQSVRIIDDPIDIQSNDIILAGSPDLDCGLAKTLIDHHKKCLRNIVFTGHMGPLVREVQEQHSCSFIRWNVHPTLSDNLRMIRHLQCRTVIPLFHPDLITVQEEQYPCDMHIYPNWESAYVTD